MRPSHKPHSGTNRNMLDISLAQVDATDLVTAYFARSFGGGIDIVNFLEQEFTVIGNHQNKGQRLLTLYFACELILNIEIARGFDITLDDDQIGKIQGLKSIIKQELGNDDSSLQDLLDSVTGDVARHIVKK